MIAGLERYVERCSPSALSSAVQCNDFGMWLAGSCMKTFTNDFIRTNDNRPNHRVWFSLSPSEARELQCARHKSLVSR
jgi:hypothetical protein